MKDRSGAVAAAVPARGGSSVGLFDQQPLYYYTQGQDESFQSKQSSRLGTTNTAEMPLHLRETTEQERYQQLQIRKLL